MSRVVSSLLLACALSISFLIQSTGSVYAGLWVVFWGGFITYTLFTNNNKWERDLLTWLMLVWLCYSGLHAFFLVPIRGGAAIWVSFLIIPTYWLAMLHQDRGLIKTHIYFCGLCLAALAVFICKQWVFDDPQPFRGRISLPMINPNNMAALMNVGLISSVGAFLSRKGRVIPLMLIALFSAALWATGSRGGVLSAAVVSGIMFAAYYPKALWGLLLTPLLFFTKTFEGALEGLLSRVPVWEGSVKLLYADPIKGLGMGTFNYYYKSVRVEDGTMGMFAHNDFLQVAIELGIPAAIIFLSIFTVLFIKTRLCNLIPACVIFVVFLHTQISFHLYLPATNILLAVAFVYWRELTKGANYGSSRADILYK